MKYLSILFLGLFLGACSHHHTKPEHHHHAYEKHCAQSVAEGDLHTKGKEEYKIDHSGKVYYFSTKEKMTAFSKHLQENIKAANRNWETGRGAR